MPKPQCQLPFVVCIVIYKRIVIEGVAVYMRFAQVDDSERLTSFVLPATMLQPRR